ncbi:putative hydrolase of the HAD superfamily [Rhodobium orientis]|uniref:2-haloalkanoic acid dehalogenase n=1 Tax=Rhodobium orientis TaxID=34017 RepID=A0A327JUQ9_9HYPH|nr:HAD-IA family hydrolase [Rhodobium orientis]MBB4302775.1 putative hydrolase of the HAD superfamily [Rhodobium orientis]MBK5948555.1 2-haloalkanoic acid dehalogenase [Rhodobium orientis]RAI29821.1 2-haloalkanoic acid dehalogenase [Rhodobium orientis]
MDFARFKVLTFDIVGTCIDFEKGVLDAVRRIGGTAAAGLSDDDIFGPYMAGRDLNYGRSSEAFVEVYLHIARELGLPATPQAARDFQLSVLEWPAFDDSAEALARLRTRFRLVAMTNADRTAYSAYNHRLGLPFNDAVTCDETLCAKPDPRFFDYNRGRQSAFGYSRDEILHVAQSQHHDIGVARELGYTVCWIERRHDQPGYGASPEPKAFTEPDLRLPSLGALADTIFGAP